ncbi:MAG: alpha/beta fold hydrolase [Pseudomonadota bacterium]
MSRLVISLVLLVTPTNASSEIVSVATKYGPLVGTLTGPADAMVSVLLIGGSGPTDRDGNQPGLVNDSLKLLAEGLNQHDVLTLRYDKRFAGASVPDGLREIDLRFHILVEDAHHWLRFLSSRAPAAKQFVIGHSQGGLVAFLVAQTLDDLGGVVGMAAPGRPVDVLIESQIALHAPKLSEEIRIALRQLRLGQPVEYSSAKLANLLRPSVQPFLRSWMMIDPANVVETITTPTLLLYGGRDIQVRPQEGDYLVRANPAIRTHTVPEMNHVLKRVDQSPESQRQAYTDPTLPLASELVRILVDFISTSTKRTHTQGATK